MGNKTKTFLWILAHAVVASVAILFVLKMKEKHTAKDDKKPQPSLFNNSNRIIDPRF